MSGTGDERAMPRPEYGEYATPEQIAAARGMSLDELNREIALRHTPKSHAPQAHTPKTHASQPDTPRASSEPAPVTAADVAAPLARKARPAHPADRFVTIALLTFGLVMVLFTIPNLGSLSTSLQLAYEQVGIGSIANTGFADALGVTAIVIQLLIWVATAAAAVLRLQRGKLAWWVPLVGGAVAAMVVLIVFIVVLTSDPTFGDYVSRLG